MSLKLSYILPVFNVEQWIAQCLDSIYAQRLIDEEFEVICIDDCSPDNSIKIIKQYKAIHDNIIIISHAYNKKAGGARNTGLYAARGEYIWFVDPDDTLVPSITGKLLRKIIADDIDVLSFNIFLQYRDELKKDTTFHHDIPVCSGMDFLHIVFGKGLIYHLGYPYRSIYKRSLLIDNHICFPECMSYGEDTTFMAEAICAANRVSCVNDYIYTYRQNPSSVSTQLFKEMRGDLIYESCIQAGDMVVRLYQMMLSKSELVAEELKVGIPWFVNRLFLRLIKTNRAERRMFYKTLNASENVNHAIFAYMDAKNRYIVKHPICGMIMLDIISKAYKLKHGSKST